MTSWCDHYSNSFCCLISEKIHFKTIERNLRPIHLTVVNSFRSNAASRTGSSTRRHIHIKLPVQYLLKITNTKEEKRHYKLCLKLSYFYHNFCCKDPFQGLNTMMKIMRDIQFFVTISLPFPKSLLSRIEEMYLHQKKREIRNRGTSLTGNRAIWILDDDLKTWWHHKRPPICHQMDTDHLVYGSSFSPMK